MAADQGDMKAHEQTYGGFINMFKWGAIVSFLTAMILLIFVL